MQVSNVPSLDADEHVSMPPVASTDEPDSKRRKLVRDAEGELRIEGGVSASEFITVKQGEWQIEVARADLLAASKNDVEAMLNESTLILPPNMCKSKHDFMWLFGSVLNTRGGETFKPIPAHIDVIHSLAWLGCSDMVAVALPKLFTEHRAARDDEEWFELAHQYKISSIHRELAFAWIRRTDLTERQKHILGPHFFQLLQEMRETKQAYRLQMYKLRDCVRVIRDLATRNECNRHCVAGCVDEDGVVECMHVRCDPGCDGVSDRLHREPLTATACRRITQFALHADTINRMQDVIICAFNWTTSHDRI